VDLKLRNDVVLSSVIAVHMAVRLMKHKTYQGTSDRVHSLLTSLEQVEARLRLLVPHHSSQLLLEPLAQWMPTIVSADSSETLLLSYLNRARVSGVSHTSLLDGSLCSFLRTISLLMLYDSTIQERTEQLVTAGSDAYVQWIKETREDIEQLMSSPLNPDGSPTPAVLAAIAAVLLHVHSMSYVPPLLYPQFLASTVGRHPQLGIDKPCATAHLEIVVAKLELSEEQLKKIYEVGQVYQALADPLVNQKSATHARMAELLAAEQGNQPAAVPASNMGVAAAAGTSPSPAATATGGGGGAATGTTPLSSAAAGSVDVGSSALLGDVVKAGSCSQGAASPEGSLASPSSEDHAGAGGAGATAAARERSSDSSPPATEPSSTPAHVPLLADGVYYELLALADQVPAVEGQLFFLDLICSHVLAGVLSWWQLAQYFVASHPYQPHVFFMGRLLFKRALDHFSDASSSQASPCDGTKCSSS
jgi:hypothetical protein